MDNNNISSNFTNPSLRTSQSSNKNPLQIINLKSDSSTVLQNIQRQPSQSHPPDSPQLSAQNSQSPRNQKQTRAIKVRDELSELDEGCFIFYRFLLILYLVCEVLYLVYITKWVVFQHTTMLVVDIISLLFPVYFIVIEYQAIKQRSLEKARIAVIGFSAYVVVYGLTYFLLACVFVQDPLTLLVEITLRMLTFFVLVVFGALQVYYVIENAKKNPNGSYQKMSIV